VAIVEMAKAGTAHFDSGAVQACVRCANVMRVGEIVEASSIPTARQDRAERSGHWSRMWTHTELRSARIDSSRRGCRSSVRKRFLIRGLARVDGREKMHRKPTDQAPRNLADRVVGHRAIKLRSARNVRANGELRRHSAKPANVEAIIAIHNLRCRQIAPSRRMEIRSEVHHHPAEETALK
jgi:hypothetical protein